MLNKKTLARAAAVTTVAALGLGLTACGSDNADGTVELKFLNYGGWVGGDEIANFEEANPGIKIKELSLPEGGSSALAAQLSQNEGSYDMVAVGNASAGRLDAADALEEFDASQVENLSLVPEDYKTDFPWGVPTNLGKTALLVDSEDVADPPTSWKELFDRADEWSGKILFPDYDLDVQAIALLALGYDINSDDPQELKEAEELVVGIKPHLLAFGGEPAKRIADGSVDIAVAHDYDYASVDPAKVEWIAPSEGTPGYIEGIALAPGTEHAEEAYKFMNFRLDPENYAGFIDNTGATPVTTENEDLFSEEIRNNPALQEDPNSPFIVLEFVSADATQIRAEMWNRIKAS